MTMPRTQVATSRRAKFFIKISFSLTVTSWRHYSHGRAASSSHHSPSTRSSVCSPSGPTHGFAISKALQPDTEVGRVITVRRPLVYRALDRLVDAGLAEPAHTEPGAAGPNRVIHRVTRPGRRRLDSWLASPVSHVRDMRIEFQLKLALLQRLGRSPLQLVIAQRETLDPTLAALEVPSSEHGRPSRTVATSQRGRRGLLPGESRKALLGLIAVEMGCSPDVNDPILCGIVNDMEPTTRPGGGYVLFATAVTLGGSNFLAVRLSNRELDPFWGAGLRFTLAAADIRRHRGGIALALAPGQAAHPHNRQWPAWHLHLLRPHVLGPRACHGRERPRSFWRWSRW